MSSYLQFVFFLNWILYMSPYQTSCASNNTGVKGKEHNHNMVTLTILPLNCSSRQYSKCIFYQQPIWIEKLKACTFLAYEKNRQSESLKLLERKGYRLTSLSL